MALFEQALRPGCHNAFVPALECSLVAHRVLATRFLHQRHGSRRFRFQAWRGRPRVGKVVRCPPARTSEKSVPGNCMISIPGRPACPKSGLSRPVFDFFPVLAPQNTHRGLERFGLTWIRVRISSKRSADSPSRGCDLSVCETRVHSGRREHSITGGASWLLCRPVCPPRRRRRSPSQSSSGQPRCRTCLCA